MRLLHWPLVLSGKIYTDRKGSGMYFGRGAGYGSHKTGGERVTATGGASFGRYPSNTDVYGDGYGDGAHGFNGDGDWR